MKSFFVKSLLSLAMALFCGFTVYGTSYTWTGSTSRAWNTTTNWNPNGLPDSLDNVTIVTTTNTPLLSQNRKVNTLTMTSGTLDLAGYQLVIKGTANFNGGTIQNGTVNPIGLLGHFAGTHFNATVTAKCGYFHMNGGQFDLPVTLEDTGYASTSGTGASTFNDSLTITHRGTVYFNMATTTGDVFNGPVKLINYSTHEINIASADSSVFNDNIEINSTNSGGILFGNAGGKSVLASGKTISVGSVGFTNDYLTLKKFTQLGSAAQTLTLTGSGAVNSIDGVFNGSLTISAAGFLLKNNTFNGTTNFTKNGTANYQSDGGNIFFGATTISNSGSAGRIRLATTTYDTYKNNATFNSTGQDVQVAYIGDNYFEGDITINSIKVVFNTSTGRVYFTGNNGQSLNGGYNFAFKKVTINKNNNHVTANSTLSVDDSLVFTKGNLVTSSTNLLTMKSGSMSFGASANSFVSGPVKKIGSSTFQFPIGKGTTFRKVEITAPSTGTDAFTAEYIDSTQTFGSSMDTTINFISDCGYWSLNRNVGTSNITPKFDFDSTHCDYIVIRPVHIAFWNGTKWIDKGVAVTDGSAKKTSAAITSYGNYSMAYRLFPGDAPQMPYELNTNITCSSTDILFENKNFYFSFKPDSAVLRVALLKDDFTKYYAAIENIRIFNNYQAGDSLTTIESWEFGCDSILSNSTSVSMDLDTSSQYILKISKYIASECTGINDSVLTYIHPCIINCRMNINPTILFYSDELSLTNQLFAAQYGDLVAPDPAITDKEFDISTTLRLWPGVTLTGDYDLQSSPIAINLPNYTYNTTTSPTGILIRSSVRENYILPPNQNYGLPETGYTFVMANDSKIQNIRIQGAMPGYLDYNNDLLLCAGIKMINSLDPTSILGTYEVQDCEIFNFTYTGIFAGVKTQTINIKDNSIHHINCSGDGSTPKGYGIWLQNSANSSITPPTYNIENNIFDQCKTAVDLQPYLSDFNIIQCSFGKFFNQETINKHSLNNASYNHPAQTISGGTCDYFATHNPTSCTGSSTASTFSITEPAAGNTTIENNLFYQRGLVISIPYPANTVVGPATIQQVKIIENTFSELIAPASSFSCNYGGYARLNDNYIEECTWDYDRTHNTAGTFVGAGNVAAILTNSPNTHSYDSGISSTTNCSGCPQPPEVLVSIDTPVGSVPGFLSNNSIPFIEMGDDITLNLSPSSFGSDDIVYVVRPQTNNGASVGIQNSSGNNGYNSSELIAACPSNPCITSLTFTPGVSSSDPNYWNTSLPGLYGIDVASVDNATNYTSLWKHQPIIVNPIDENLFIFNIKDTYYAEFNNVSTPMNVFKQVELNGHIIWQEDLIEGGDDWERIQINLLTDKYNNIDISTFINPQFPTQTLTFSIAIPDPTIIDTDILRGVNVFIDDVYLKKFDSPENLVKDGDVENMPMEGLSSNPTDESLWYSDVKCSFVGCPSLDDVSTSTVDAISQAGVSSIERKSGNQAIRLKLDGLHNNSVCSVYPAITYPPGYSPDQTNFAAISAAIDFDYRDFIGCSEYSALGFTQPFQPGSGTTYTITGTETKQTDKIILDNDLVIAGSGSLLLEGCQVVVISHTPPWTITVESGANLSIVPYFVAANNPANTASNIFGCEEMWTGIVNNGGTINMYTMPVGSPIAHTPSGYPTAIEDALTAIESDGGVVEVRYVHFNNNYRSFVLYEDVHDFTGNPFIKGCNFECTNGAILKEPLDGWEPYSYVELNNINNATFTIGDGGGLRNEFSGAVYGIKSSNTSINIENNLFKNMVRDDDQYYRRNDGTSILAHSNSGNTINIFGGNEFEDSPQAITTNGNIDIDINTNSFNNTLGGINITNNAFSVSNIYNNTFTSVSTAIIGRNCTGIFQVYDNTFTNTVPASISSMPYTNFNSTAVTIQNPKILGTGLIRVFGNLITDYRIGIHSRNIQYFSVGSDLFTTNYGTPNTIIFNQPEFNANHRGIWLENCPDAQVQENTINQSSAAAPTGNSTVEGITIAGGVKSLINLNVLNQLQVPIHLRDNCSDTELHCNEMHNDANPGSGVLLTSAVLPPQGSSGSPWNNKWYGYNSTTLFGVTTDVPGIPFDWFFSTVSSEFNPNPDPNAALGQPTSSGGIICAVEAAPGDPDRDVRYVDIVEDSLSFVDYVDEFTYKSKQYLLEKMNADTSLLVRNTSKDTLFREFYSYYKRSNIGLFLQVDSLILAGNLDAAFTLNNSITDTNQIETNQKTVNDLLVTKVLRDSVLNEADSTTLQEIAIQDPILGGKAVFIARAVLFEEIHDILPALRKSAQISVKHNSPDPLKSSIMIVPNPAKDKCQIHFLNMECEFIIELKNSVGQIVYYNKIQKKTSSFELDLSEFNPGFYSISINDGFNIFEQKKLIIVR